MTTSSTNPFDLDAMLLVIASEITGLAGIEDLPSESMLTAIATDLASSRSATERRGDRVQARAFSQRIAGRASVARAQRRLVASPLRECASPVIATASQAIALASQQRCAPILDLAAAAGSGRTLWDESCESWLVLPSGLPSARYIALGVAGDSMVPVLAPRDVILVDLDATPAVDDLVVARSDESSYVVKRLSALTPSTAELSSFNPDYPPVHIARERDVMLGVVVARFTRRAM